VIVIVVIVMLMIVRVIMSAMPVVTVMMGHTSSLIATAFLKQPSLAAFLD
jgi:hypothetical protein